MKEFNADNTLQDLHAEFQDFLLVDDFVNAQAIIQQIAQYDVLAADACRKELQAARYEQ